MRNVKWADGPPVVVLRNFCRVAESLSNSVRLGDSASQAKKSVSTISDMIALLENYYGGEPLLIRKGSGLELTDWGTILYEQARKVVREHELCRKDRLAKKRESETIRVGTQNTIILNVLDKVLKDFRAASTNKELILVLVENRRTDDLLNDLRAGVLDLVIAGSFGETCNGLIQERLDVEVPMVLVVPPEHFLAESGPRPVHLRELNDQNIAVIREDLVDLLQSPPGTDPASKGFWTIVENYSSVAKLVDSGGCAGILAGWKRVIDDLRCKEPELRVLTIAELNKPKRITCYYREKDKDNLRPSVNRLLEAVRKHLNGDKAREELAYVTEQGEGKSAMLQRDERESTDGVRHRP